MRERVFVGGNHTSASLVAMCADLTAIQAEKATVPFIGKWLQVTGLIHDVSPSIYNHTAVSFYEYPDQPKHHVFLSFSGDREKLENAHKQQILICQGQIDQIKSDILILNNCEVIDVLPAPPLKPSLAEQIAQMGEKEESEDPPSRTADKPRLSDAALKAWHSAFLLAYPDGAKALAEKSALGAFPNHHVARERVRELFPDARRGRPKKNNELDNSPKNGSE